MCAVTVLEDVFSPGQAAKWLGVSWQRVDQLCRSGKLSYTLTPLGRMIRLEDLEDLRHRREEREALKRQRESSSAEKSEAVAD